MKAIKLLLLLALVLAVSSCQRDEEPEFQKEKLVSATLVRSISAEEAEGLFTLARQFYPEVPDYAQQVVGGVRMYYVEYASTYLEGEPIVLSGLVCVPDDPSRNSMLVSIQNGTLVEHGQAPSKDLGDPALLLMQAMASLGYVMVIQDYIGFGASEAYPHPYHVKPLFQSTVRDMLLATREMAESGDYPFMLSGEVFLAGYSLGGWASLVSHHYLENDPLEGLTLVGSACGAGAYDLLNMQEYLFEQTEYGQPYYIALLFSGYGSVGAIEDDLSLYFNEPYDERIPGLMDGEHSPAEINASLSYNISELLSSRLLEEFHTHSDFAPLIQALEDNSQHAWVNRVPIHLFHGDADEDIPISISEDLYGDFLSIGAGPDEISLVRMEGKDHSSGSMSMFFTLMEMLQEGM